MKYPLTTAEKRLKEKVEKRKAAKTRLPLTKKERVYRQAEYKNDFMKYWRVVRRWLMVKHNLNITDIDMLLFLFSEGYFTVKKFEEYQTLFSWDKKRLKRLIDNGWIHIWRNHGAGKARLYEITPHCRAVIQNMYRKLNGECISEDMYRNPIFRNEAGYADKMHRNYILKLNESIRQGQRRARVSRYKLRLRESSNDQQNGHTE